MQRIQARDLCSERLIRLSYLNALHVQYDEWLSTLPNVYTVNANASELEVLNNVMKILCYEEISAYRNILKSLYGNLKLAHEFPSLKSSILSQIGLIETRINSSLVYINSLPGGRIEVESYMHASKTFLQKKNLLLNAPLPAPPSPNPINMLSNTSSSASVSVIRKVMNPPNLKNTCEAEKEEQTRKRPHT